jgi:dsRNA-specific ribonuclease
LMFPRQYRMRRVQRHRPLFNVDTKVRGAAVGEGTGAEAGSKAAAAEAAAADSEATATAA